MQLIEHKTPLGLCALSGSMAQWYGSKTGKPINYLSTEIFLVILRCPRAHPYNAQPTLSHFFRNAQA